MEETKFDQELELFSNPPDFMEIDEENRPQPDFPRIEDEENHIEQIYGDSGFDNLRSESYFDDQMDSLGEIKKNNQVFQRLFRQDSQQDLAQNGAGDKDFNEDDVDEFFGKNSPNNGKSTK